MKRSSPWLVSRIVYWIAFWLVLTVTALLYLPTLSHQFVNWDDDVHLLENRSIHALTVKNVAEIFTSTVNQTYIPLTSLSFAFEYHFFKNNPYVYHLNNLILHLMVTALVMGIGVRLGLTYASAVLAGLLFGIHPLHVESVAWVTERKDVLYAFFYLLAVFFYLNYISIRRKRWFLLALGAGFLSVLAKSTALNLPLILLLIDWYILKRVTWREIFNKFYFCACLWPIAWFTYFSNSQILTIQGLDSWLVWFWSFNFYLIHWVWPQPTALFYPGPYPVSLENWEYLLHGLGFVVVWLWVWVRRKDRIVVFAFLFYMLSIFFLLRFSVILGAVADRFMYLPSLGLCFLFGVLVHRLFSKVTGLWRIVIVSGLLFGVCGLVINSSDRMGVWKDSESLWKNQLQVNQKTARWLAYYKLGDYYLERALRDGVFNRIKPNQELTVNWIKNNQTSPEIIAQDTAKVALIIDYFHKSIEDMPSYAEPFYKLGNVYVQLEDFQTAVYFYQRSIELNSNHFRAMVELADLYRNLGRAKESIDLYQRAFMIMPHYLDLRKEILDTLYIAGKGGSGAQFYQAAFDHLRE